MLPQPEAFVTLLALLACSSPSADTHADEPVDTTSDTPCDTGGLAPQPDTDYLKRYPPVVIRTIPQAGDQAVDPSLSEITVTFGADMQDGSWAWVQIDPDLFPESGGDPTYVDARTNVLPVTLEADHTYVVWINYDPYLSFQDTHGQPAVPYQIAFHTAPE